MRGFEIERTLDEDTCSMETLPEKILKVPGIALVAAGTPACLIGLYDSAARINSLDRLFLCQISSVGPLEALFYNKKLITNNADIRRYNFYKSKKYIYFWDRLNRISQRVRKKSC